MGKADGAREESKNAAAGKHRAHWRKAKASKPKTRCTEEVTDYTGDSWYVDLGDHVNVNVNVHDQGDSRRVVCVP